MISLYRYIFEAIERNDIEKHLRFEEISFDEFEKIIMSDEYDNGKGLLGELPEEVDLDLKEQMFMIKQSNIFKIMYKNETLGVVAYVLPKNLKKFLISTEEKDRHSTHRYILWKLCLRPFITAHYYSEVSANEKVFDDPTSEETNYSYEEKIIDEIAYVTAWQLSPTAKKKIDINEISLVKVFFEKLVKELKNNGAKYFFAHGKDKRVCRLYVKLAGCINPINTYKDIWKNYNKNVYKNVFHKDEFYLVEDIVYKKI
jgi:hypothetical protein